MLIRMHATAIDNACNASTGDKPNPSSSPGVKPMLSAVRCRLGLPLADALLIVVIRRVVRQGKSTEQHSNRDCSGTENIKALTAQMSAGSDKTVFYE